MTMEEVVYQINGKLGLKYNPDNTCTVILLDNIHEPTTVRIVPDLKEVEASATGATPAEAQHNLVELLRGNILIHRWSVMWTSSTASLRIPETLMVTSRIDRMDFVSAD